MAGPKTKQEQMAASVQRLREQWCVMTHGLALLQRDLDLMLETTPERSVDDVQSMSHAMHMMVDAATTFETWLFRDEAKARAFSESFFETKWPETRQFFEAARVHRDVEIRRKADEAIERIEREIAGYRAKDQS